MRTLAQQRSQFALEKLAALRVDKDQFTREVTSFPSLVLQNGFGQAMAFNLSKEVKEKAEIVALIRQWLVSRRKLEAKDNREFLLQLSKMPVTDYLAAQREALAFIEWVKRFANAGLFGE
jgi:CRISPR-associated protein Cmr5